MLLPKFFQKERYLSSSSSDLSFFLSSSFLSSFLSESFSSFFSSSFLSFFVSVLFFLGALFFFGFGSHLLDHINSLADKLFRHNLDHLELLELLTGHIQGEIVRVDNSLNEVQVLGHELFEVLRDEHASHVKLEGTLAAIVVIVQVE